MISIFYHKKISLRRDDDENQKITSEDILTASIFDLLKYLPHNMFWSIIKSSLYHDKLPDECGEIEDIEFWAKWSSANNKYTTNTKFIEPDLFIRTYAFDLIIEAKRYDKKQQKESQLKSEVTAYKNEYKGDNKPLYFIQMGGLQELNDIQDFEDAKVCKTDWTKLLHQIDREYTALADINSPQINAHKRTLNDIIRVLEIHGFYKTLWLESLSSERQHNIYNFNFYNYATDK